MPAALSDELELYVPAPLRAHLLLEAGEAEHRQVTAAFVKFSGVDELIAAKGGPEALVRAGSTRSRSRRSGELEELGLTWLGSDIDVDGGKIYLTARRPLEHRRGRGADAARAPRDPRDATRPDAARGRQPRPGFSGDIGAHAPAARTPSWATPSTSPRASPRAPSRAACSTTADVLDRATHALRDRAAQPFLVKGKERPITAYHVGAPSARARRRRRRRAAVRRARSRAGRARAGASTRARMRQQQVVELIGEPGIGKSRLVDELRTLALGFTQLDGRCDQYSSASPYSVFRDAAAPAGRHDAGDGRRTRPARSSQPWVAAVMPDLAPLAPLIAIPFDAEVPPTPEIDAARPAVPARPAARDASGQFLSAC